MRVEGGEIEREKKRRKGKQERRRLFCSAGRKEGLCPGDNLEVEW